MRWYLHVVWLLIATAIGAHGFEAGRRTAAVPLTSRGDDQPEAMKLSPPNTQGHVGWEPNVVFKFRVATSDLKNPRLIEAYNGLYSLHKDSKLFGSRASQHGQFLPYATAVVVFESSVILEFVRADEEDGKQCNLKIRLPDGVITGVEFMNLPF